MGTGAGHDAIALHRTTMELGGADADGGALGAPDGLGGAHHPAWNEWHEQVHVSEVLREPGFVSCRKWRDTATAEDGWGRYVCHLERTGVDAVERDTASEAAKRLRADSELKFGYVTRLRRQGHGEVARFEVDTEPGGLPD